MFCGSAEFSESVQAYIDELCMGEVPSYGRFFQIAVYAEVSLLSGLQIFWIVICNGHHESFKSAVSSMNLTRNATTGQFEASDLETVRYLERKLGSSVLFLIYIVFKLVLQFIICATGISISFIHQLQWEYCVQVHKCDFEFKYTVATLQSWDILLIWWTKQHTIFTVVQHCDSRNNYACHFVWSLIATCVLTATG